MKYTLYSALSSLGLFLGMLLMLEAGRRIGKSRLTKDPTGAHAGFGPSEAAVLALLGLPLAFTVSGAGTRFDMRRHLIIEETNAIGTAYLRLDMLPSAAQPTLRQSFRRYLDSHIEVYRKLPDIAAAKQEISAANKLQGEIWRQAIAAVRAHRRRSFGEDRSLRPLDSGASRDHRGSAAHFE